MCLWAPSAARIQAAVTHFPEDRLFRKDLLADFFMTKWCYDNASSLGDDCLARVGFLAPFGILKVPTVCPKCDTAAAVKTHRGTEKLCCVNSGCAKWVSATAETVLETF